MNSSGDAHDPSVGVRRRHLPIDDDGEEALRHGYTIFASGFHLS
jgi:hypothetical protein